MVFSESSSCRQAQLISTSVRDGEDSDKTSIKAWNFIHAMIATGKVIERKINLHVSGMACNSTKTLFLLAFIATGIWVLTCIMPVYLSFNLLDYNISEKLPMQQTKPITDPYEAEKLETSRLSSTTILNLNPSTVITTTVTAEKAKAIIMEPLKLRKKRKN